MILEVIKIYFKLLAALILGIGIADRIDLLTAVAVTVGLLISNITAQLIFKNKKGYRSVIIITFFVGICISQYSQSYEMNGLYPVDDKFVTIKGYVYDIPQENEDDYTYLIKTDIAEYMDKTYPAVEIIRLNTDKKLTFMQNVEIKGFLNRFSDKMNYSDFDYARYYKSKGIYYYITDYQVNADDTIRKTINPILLIRKAKFYVIKIIDNYLDGDYAALLKAVLLGYKKAFSEDYDDLLMKTGTKRMLFPAYLHIFLIMFVIELIMMLFKKKHRDYAIIAALLLYAAVNGEIPVSMKNGMIMAAVVFVVQKYGTAHYPDIVSGVVTIILLFNPLLIYNSGMVISVMIGWTLFMVREPAVKVFSFIRNRHIRNFIVFWLVCNIGVMPLAAYYFNSVNIYSLLLNFIYFPVVTLIIFCFPIFILEMLIFGGSFLIKYALIFGVFILYHVPFIIEKLPFSYISLPRPNIFFIIIFYLSIILIKDIYHSKMKRLRTQVLTCIVAGGVISMVIVAVMNIGMMKITFVNVGQGDGAILELPKGETLIIDGGGGEEYSDYDAGEEIFLPYLKNEGIFRIDMAVVTHYHKDHCLGTIAAMKNLNVHTVAMPDVMKDNKYRKEIEDIAKEKGIEIVYLEGGDRITFESGAQIDIISPDIRDDFEEENDTSIVLELKCNNFKALFTGDATENVEYKNINYFEDVDLLKVTHHGSDSSTSEKFLEVIKPEYSVISVGENNPFLHPDDIVVKRLENAGSKIFRTDILGDIRINVSKTGKVSINSFYSELNQ